MIRRMGGGENFRDAVFFAFGFLEHRKLIGPDGLVFVDSGFHVPAREVAAIRAGECASAEATDRGPLPQAVVYVAGVERGLFCAGVFEGLADGALPGGLRDVVVALSG